MGPPGGGAVTADIFEGMLRGVEADGALARAGAVVTGYFAGADQVLAAAGAIDKARAANPAVRIVVDPIMGDTPKGLYVPAQVAAAIADHLVPRADLVAPNAWELSRLAGRPLDDPLDAARSLGRPVLVSSIDLGQEIGVIYADARQAWLAAHRPTAARRQRHGRPLDGRLHRRTAVGRRAARGPARGCRRHRRQPRAWRQCPSGTPGMNDTDIRGLCPPRFAAVREAFAANFAEGRELGARFALAIDGEIVVDLLGGWADRHQTRPFAADTLTPVFSTTKAITSLMLARLVGQGRLAYPSRVADLWPQFAQAGKGEITVEQVLSHQAGLAGLPEPTSPADWFDWDAICARLAAMTPLWPPGSASGYHPVTFGYLAGEIFRRADGRTIGRALREDLAGPLGLDVWIGLPDNEHHRCADMRRPPAMPDLGEITEIRRLAFLTKGASPGGMGEAAWRRAEIPSANGHATAPALARLMAALAADGEIAGQRILAPGAAAAAARQRIVGQDLVLPYVISWAAGFIRNQALGLYGPGAETIGHSGWGGSCAFADPERGFSGAYVMNRQSAELIADPRAGRLIDAAYTGL